MQQPSILISGSNGQLGKELQDAVASNNNFNFIFCSREEMDITNFIALEKKFDEVQPTFFINAAAYTAVDKAETEQEAAYTNNAEAVGNIARLCSRFQTKLIHVSTDYVFNGQSNVPYKEDDNCDPVNYYGYTKWLGEKLALENNDNTIIIRTSWVYSAYGNNFVKTMLRLMKERKEINVVNDQFGSPTYAKDLSEAILQIVQQQLQNKNTATGIFHFSNDGIINWYDFATEIKNLMGFDCVIHPIASSQYKTAAKRPAYSGLSKEKIQRVYGIQLQDWKKSLQICLERLV
ncbi:MAG TPA: dTDP-4-dehydrorhamnose reductase [Chitinophagaceae bacterium]|nr:dTDP-4-dehydrorhamnose reductase [Chitinophagaceae bacterium]